MNNGVNILLRYMLSGTSNDAIHFELLTFWVVVRDITITAAGDHVARDRLTTLTHNAVVGVCDRRLVRIVHTNFHMPGV
jgi:hypothetical protein